MTALPVTVSFTRHVAPDRVDQMIAWVRAGSALGLVGEPGPLAAPVNDSVGRR
ncbi:MAG: hypothetical protein ABIQ59_08545 [Nocardioidaceae bacterium]